MVLEEEIQFPDEEAADDFIKFMHKKGFSAKKRVSFQFYQESVVMGVADDLITWLEEEIQNIDENEENTDNPLLSESLEDDDSIEEEIDSSDEDDYNHLFNKTEFSRLLELIRYNKDLISECFQNYTTGDEIPKINSEELLSEFRESIAEHGTYLPEHKVGVHKIKDHFALHFLLSENDLLEEKEEKLFLKKVIEPGQFHMEMPASLPNPSLKSAADRNVTIKEIISTDQQYIIRIEPDIVLFPDLQELLDWFMENDLEEESINNFLTEMIFKQTILF